MQNLKPAELSTVVGGAKQTDQLTQQITALQTSLKDAVSANNNGGNNNQTFMLLAMVMAMRPQPTVVAAGGPPPVVAAAPAAPSSVVNISNRIRHF